MYKRFIIGTDKFNNRVFISISAKTQKALHLPLNDCMISYTPADGKSWERSDYYKTGGMVKFTVELISVEVDVIYSDFKQTRKESDFSYSMGAMRPNKIEYGIEFKKEFFQTGNSFQYDLNNVLQSCDLRFDVTRK